MAISTLVSQRIQAKRTGQLVFKSRRMTGHEVVIAGGGPTASEADVLESLAARREQLDARERELDMREKVIAAAEKRVEERITELKQIEQRIETMFGKRDEQEEAQLASLVKTYEAMKPADAAEMPR